MKRKYTKAGESCLGFKCTKNNCNWEGLDEERSTVKKDDMWEEFVCPKCGNNEFYGLIEKPKKIC